MAKSNLRYITVSDTETSGLPSKGGKGKEPVLAFHDILLVEVAAVVIDIWDMKIVDEYDVIIKPYVDKYVWQPQAEATHGLSQDHLFKNGVDIKEAYRGYASILSKYKNPKVGAVLCGHNFQGFDIPFIEEMFKWNKDDLYILHGKVSHQHPCASRKTFTVRTSSKICAVRIKLYHVSPFKISPTLTEIRKHSCLEIVVRLNFQRLVH
jgi:hypothetical protein